MSHRTELLAIAAVNALRPFFPIGVAAVTCLGSKSWKAEIATANALLARYDAALLQEYPNGIPVKNARGIGGVEVGRVNLLRETLDVLEANGKQPSDVRWVGVLKPQYFAGQKVDAMPVGSWADFARWSNFTYDNGYGGAEIAMHLLIVGSDWWLERGEYDGSEWWEFKTLPKQADVTTPLRPSDLKDRP